MSYASWNRGRDAGETALATAMLQPVAPRAGCRYHQVSGLLICGCSAMNERRSSKLSKADKAAHNAIHWAHGQIVKDLDRLVDDEKELAEKFEKMPKRVDDPLKEEALQATLQDLDELQEKWANVRRERSTT